MLIFRRRRARTPTQYSTEHAQALSADLRTVARFTQRSPVDVYLTGGLSISMLHGSFYRQHHDIDKAVFAQDLPAFNTYAAQSGYKLMHRMASIRLGRYVLQVLQPVTPDQVMTRQRSHLRLVAPNQGNHQLCDLFVYRQHGDMVRTSDDALFRAAEFFPVTTLPYGEGFLRIPNPSYLRGFKTHMRRDDASTKLDLQMIDTYAK